MLTVPYTQKARVNASSGIRSGSKLWRMEHFRDVTKMMWRAVPDLNRRRTSQKGALPTELTTRIAGLRCKRTALQSKDCLRQARGDFNPDPLRRRTRFCSSSLPFDQYEIPTSATESSCCADGWGRTSSLRLSWLGGAPPVELHRHIARRPGVAFRMQSKLHCLREPDK